MTDKEAMKLALDALIWTTGSGDFSEGGQAHDGAKKCLFPAITALKERLAQPEQEPVKVSPLEFVEMVIEKEHLVGKPIFWAEWPNKENT